MQTASNKLCHNVLSAEIWPMYASHCLFVYVLNCVMYMHGKCICNSNASFFNIYLRSGGRFAGFRSVHPRVQLDQSLEDCADEKLIVLQFSPPLTAGTLQIPCVYLHSYKRLSSVARDASWETPNDDLMCEIFHGLMDCLAQKTAALHYGPWMIAFNASEADSELFERTLAPEQGRIVPWNTLRNNNHWWRVARVLWVVTKQLLGCCKGTLDSCLAVATLFWVVTRVFQWSCKSILYCVCVSSDHALFGWH